MMNWQMVSALMDLLGTVVAGGAALVAVKAAYRGDTSRAAMLFTFAAWVKP